MNRTNFNNTGGFPLKTERLQELETAYKIFNSLGYLAGDLTIVSGCETVGTTVKNGSIFLNGEIIEFREASGLDANSRVIIITDEILRPFENGNVKVVHTIRYATFGTADTSWLWSSFKRPIATKDIEAMLTGITNRLSTVENKLTPIESKLGTIESGAQKNVQADWDITNSASDAYIKNKKNFLTALHQGTVNIGNLTSNSFTIVINFGKNIGTSNYQVVLSIVSNSADFNQDNNVFENTREHTATSFRLCMREMHGIDQNISINYLILPL